MNIPTLPTDNLYKFMTFLGVIIAAIGYFVIYSNMPGHENAINPDWLPGIFRLGVSIIIMGGVIFSLEVSYGMLGIKNAKIK